MFDTQVVELKRLIKAFNPKEVVIDINGIGVSFADAMIKESWDEKNNEMLPAYGFSNREEYLTLQPRGCAKILYGIKATAQINSDMHSGLYSKVYQGKIKFLVSEQTIKSKINSTRKGFRMAPEVKNQRMLPHELTSIMINEIMNLKIRPTGVSNQIAVERINERMLKDKFSALEMGVYRVILIEQEHLSRRRNRGLGRRTLTFTSRGTDRGGGHR